MIELPPDLLAALVAFTVLSVGALAVASMPDANAPIFEDNDHE